MPYADPEKNKQACKARYRRNREAYLLRNIEWVSKNREKWNAYTGEWARKHKDQVNANKRRRRLEDPNYALRERLSHRVRMALKSQGIVKENRIKDLTGCSISFLKQHIESQFLEGMNWGNIHIDHIRPCASFDLTKPEEQRACFHYSNLRPLFPRDNMIKNSRWNGRRYLKGK